MCNDSKGSLTLAVKQGSTHGISTAKLVLVLLLLNCLVKTVGKALVRLWKALFLSTVEIHYIKIMFLIVAAFM